MTSGTSPSPAAQWLGLRASSAGGTGLIPGRGTKIPYAAWCDQKKKVTSTTRCVCTFSVRLLEQQARWMAELGLEQSSEIQRPVRC